MKKKVASYLILLLIFYIVYSLIFQFNFIKLSINKSVTLWYQILPSLFFGFLINDLIFEYNYLNIISNKLKYVFHLMFNIKQKSTNIFLLSLIAGFPSGAKNIANSYQKKEINPLELEKLLTFTHYANPLFIINVIGHYFGIQIALIILFSHYLSGIIVGTIFKHFYPSPQEETVTRANSLPHFANILINSLKNNLNSLFMILGIMTVFITLSNLILDSLKINSYIATIIKLLLEITSGIESLSNLNISNFLKIILLTSALSFGSLSIHLQVISFINETKIRYHPYLLARIIQVGISIIISLILSLTYFYLLI